MDEEDEELICDYCEEEADELIRTDDGKHLCISCLEDSDYHQCDCCERWFEYLTDTPAGENLCDECLESSDTTYEDFTGECRFLMETVNYEILNLDKNLEKELREKLTLLIRRALADGDKESRGTLNAICWMKKYNTNNYSDNMLKEIIADCMSDDQIVQVLRAFGYDVCEELMSQGAHGHDTYGVIYVK